MDDVLLQSRAERSALHIAPLLGPSLTLLLVCVNNVQAVWIHSASGQRVSHITQGPIKTFLVSLG